MQKDCFQLLDIIDTKIVDLKAYLSEFSSSELSQLPAKDKWSAIMTVHHLILAESGSLAYCKKKLSFNPELLDATEEEMKMESKVPYMLRSPKYKVKAPPGLDAEFLDNTMTLDTAFDRWMGIRAEVRSFLESQPAEIFSKALYKHPLAGKMRLIGMIMFFDGHLDSHTTQIKGNFEMMRSQA